MLQSFGESISHGRRAECGKLSGGKFGFLDFFSFLSESKEAVVAVGEEAGPLRRSYWDPDASRKKALVDTQE